MKKLNLYFIIFFTIFNFSAHGVEIAFEEDSALPVVYLNVAIKTGSVSDPPQHSGLTFFMGRAMLRGTKKLSRDQIDDRLDQMGASLTVTARAEAMVLRGAVLTSQLDPFLELLEDIVSQPSFPYQEIEKLQSKVKSELLGELNNDRELAGRGFERVLFDKHPYGRPVKGTSDEVSNFSRKKIVDHYNHLFKAGNLLVVGTGDAKLNTIRQFSNRLKKKIPEGGTIPELPFPKNRQGRKLLIVDKPDRTQTQIYVGHLGVRMTHPSFFALYVGNHVFGGGSDSSRLFSEVRNKRGWSYGAYSYFRHGTRPRTWNYWIFPASKDTPAALELTVKMLEDLKKNGITKEEFEFAKKSLINNAQFMYDTPKKRVENILLERTLNLPDGFMKTYAKRIKEVELEQVNQALREFIDPQQIAIAVLGTAKDLTKKLSSAAKIDDQSVEVIPYNKL